MHRFTALFCLSILVTNAFSEESDEYRHARYMLWTQVYPDGGRTLYCGRKFGSRHGRDVNVEHVFPMSWAINTLKCGDRNECSRHSKRFNEIESDLHNLYPALKDINYERGSMSYGNVRGEPRDFGRCDFEIDRRKRRVEPRESVRGDIARAMFYMADRYKGLELFSSQRRLLKEWHRNDPPDDEERRRNDIIEKLQGNRNRYIDEPGLVDKL